MRGKGGLEYEYFIKKGGVKFQVGLCERYSSLQKPMSVRKQKLLDSLQVQQLFRDVEDEEAWIREKEPVAGSTNRGCYFARFTTR